MDSSIIIIIVMLVLIWQWFIGRKVNEIANHIAENNCIKRNVQFLDGTVSLISIGIARGIRGSLSLKRTYQFEFNNDNNRCRGYISLTGYKVNFITMDDITDYY